MSKRPSGTAAMDGVMGVEVGALEAFDINGQGAALIDRQGKIFRINKVADQLLSDDVRIVKGRLVGTDRAAREEFDRVVGKLLKHSTASLQHPIAFARKGRRPLLAYPAKLDCMTQNAVADCRAIVIFVDTEAGPRPPETALQVAFRLSDAEARLAVQLALGEPLEEAADRIGIAKETARSQLKSVFAKTGCHRQPELVAMLSALLKRQG